jgi:hypothetical protein
MAAPDYIDGLFGKDIALNGVTIGVRRGELNIVTGDGVSAELIDDAANERSQLSLEVDGDFLEALSPPLTTAFFVDAGTAVAEVDQTGASSAPFDSIQDAVTALDEVAIHSVLLAPGVYAGFTLNSVSDFCAIRCLGRTLITSAITVTAGTIDIYDALIASSCAVATSQFANFVDCSVSAAGQAALTGTGAVTYTRGYVTADSMACAILQATGTTITVPAISITTGSQVVLRNVRFEAQTVLTFTGSAGTVVLDESSYGSWCANGCTVVNGTIVTAAKWEPWTPSSIGTGLSVGTTGSIEHRYRLVGGLLEMQHVIRFGGTGIDMVGTFNPDLPNGLTADGFQFASLYRAPVQVSYTDASGVPQACEQSYALMSGSYQAAPEIKIPPAVSSGAAASEEVIFTWRTPYLAS